MNDTPIQARAEMLIRKPVAEVFEAFINPEITTKFWFTKSSRRLEEGKQIEWTWEMYGVSGQLLVKAIEQNRRILIQWLGDDQSTVEWLFKPLGADKTFVSIINTGFSGNTDEIIKQALNATEAYTTILAGLKALLEHNIRLNLIADRFPEGIEPQ